MEEGLLGLFVRKKKKNQVSANKKARGRRGIKTGTSPRIVTRAEEPTRKKMKEESDPKNPRQ